MCAALITFYLSFLVVNHCRILTFKREIAIAMKTLSPKLCSYLIHLAAFIYHVDGFP